MKTAMPSWLLLILPALAAATSGCILPVPHVKRTCHPVAGTVLDGRTRVPVADAAVHICYPDGGQRTTRTGPAGRFRFPAKHRFHWGYLFGVALNYSLPYDCGWFDFTAVTVDAPGYRPVRFLPTKEHRFAVDASVRDPALAHYTIIHPTPGRPVTHPLPSDWTWTYPAILLPPIPADGR